MFKTLIKLTKPVQFIALTDKDIISAEILLQAEKNALLQEKSAQGPHPFIEYTYDPAVLLRSQELVVRKDELLQLRELEKLLLEIKTAIHRFFDTQLEYQRNALVQCEGKVVDMAMAIARKIVAKEIQTDPEIVLHTVGRALASVGNDKQWTLQINPADKALIEKYLQKFAADNLDVIKWNLEENSALTSGGCIVRTLSSTIDARIESQLNMIQSLLLDHFGNGNNGKNGHSS